MFDSYVAQCSILVHIEHDIYCEKRKVQTTLVISTSLKSVFVTKQACRVNKRGLIFLRLSTFIVYIVYLGVIHYAFQILQWVSLAIVALPLTVKILRFSMKEIDTSWFFSKIFF